MPQGKETHPLKITTFKKLSVILYIKSYRLPPPGNSGVQVESARISDLQSVGL
jgi:hypothetical protein